MPSDKRQYPRKFIEATVAFQIGDGPRTEARCRDVSLGGMFIETSAAPPYGSAVRVFIQLPGVRGETVIAAIVRWSKPDGMGVQFGVMGARETHGLTQMLVGQ